MEDLMDTEDLEEDVPEFEWDEDKVRAIIPERVSDVLGYKPNSPAFVQLSNGYCNCTI